MDLTEINGYLYGKYIKIAFISQPSPWLVDFIDLDNISSSLNAWISLSLRTFRSESENKTILVDIKHVYFFMNKNSNFSKFIPCIYTVTFFYFKNLWYIDFKLLQINKNYYCSNALCTRRQIVVLTHVNAERHLWKNIQVFPKFKIQIIKTYMTHKDKNVNKW